MAKAKKKKNSKHKREGTRRNASVSGLIMGFRSRDPLNDDIEERDNHHRTYTHTNPLLRNNAGIIYTTFRKYIFANELNWKIEIEPINLMGDSMVEPVEILGRYKLDDLTENIHEYLEEMNESIDVDFFDYVQFTLTVTK